jgi:hypothetical protein
MYLIKQIKERLFQPSCISCLKKASLVVIAMASTHEVHGQDLKQYSVEVIIFEQLEVTTAEDLSPQAINLSTMSLISLLEKPPKEAEAVVEKIIDAGEELIEPSSEETEELPDEDFVLENSLQIDQWFERNAELKELDNIYRRLNRRQEYKILHKFSWLQPALAEPDTPYIHEIFDDHGLAIRLYQSRYLHLDLLGYMNGNFISAKNRELIESIKLVVSPPSDLLDETPKTSSEPMTEESLVLEGIVDYVLREDRRIFQNESHFFDHPKMGIIVSVYDSPL